ncbi:UvrD-helicase domain-containing protein [Candidatus Saccharibacteria bacterium]|nr:UvrD-helicase domain-containing protein [Candidatus Saccharibacteria bacterium]MBQ6605555.1 UvrD-helicase domain-containing protein [Candidatus Saccharibacteria bacterium]
MNEIFGGLNEKQLEAVKTLEGPLLILAGAGSGKTKTLTHRIANLLKHGVFESEILAVTFTNKAAREMRERLWKILGNGTEAPRSFMPYMGTFHGICVRILRIEYLAAGLERNFTIYDTEDQVSLIKRIMKTLKITDKSLKPKSIIAIISKAKNEGKTPEEYKEGAYYPNQRKIARIYQRYEEEKEAANALDFDDLLLRALKMFRENSEVREKWRERFKYILIDEYQDTNSVQYRLIKLLVNEKQNICVVGDDWQSIYSWRGADFTNILNFTNDFPTAKVIKLEQNYRSTGNILAASQKIINNNKQRSEKTLFTEAGEGEPIRIKNLRDETGEANFVATQILAEAEKRAFSDFAILYRTNAQSYAFEKALINAHIPYKIVGGVRFYDRREVKDVLSILHLILNPRDKIALERVTKNVLSGVGEKSLEKIFSYLDGGEERKIGDLELSESLTAKARAAVLKLAKFIGRVREEQENLRPNEIVERAVREFDFMNLLDDGTPSGKERINNLAVLVDNASPYENLEDFLADAALMSSADESSAKNSVTLMTLHAAKGLEFPVVFMVGMEDGLFPSSRSETEAEIEEERRLAYVGMTRAMEELFLTFAESRFSFGGRSYTSPSRFLSELDYNPYSEDFERDEFSDGFEDDPFPEEEVWREW